MAKSDIRVKLSSELSEYAYGEPLTLDYRVENRSAKPRFVVTDTFVAEAKTASELHLLVGEAPLPRELYYFDYQAPALVRVAPRTERSFRTMLALPLLETALDPDGNAYDSEVRVSGVVTILLRVGFLDSSFRPRSANPWGEFVAAQQLSFPARTRVRVQSRA